MLHNKPNVSRIQNSSSEYQYGLICEVVAGKCLKRKEDIKHLKRLPIDPNDKQFYDSLYIEEENEDFVIGIFDIYRIYPSYLIKFEKDIDSETNYTTDDNSKFYKHY